MKRGTPVIARRIGPFPEIVEASGGGELFDGPEDLLAAMRRILGDPGRRRALGRAGQESQQRLWSESAVVPRYLDLVRRIAERRGIEHTKHALTETVTT
jgi:glycosyltransferase involved in cell wall biosynthesis